MSVLVLKHDDVVKIGVRRDEYFLYRSPIFQLFVLDEWPHEDNHWELVFGKDPHIHMRRPFFGIWIVGEIHIFTLPRNCQ